MANNKKIDTDKLVRWIEDGIPKYYINYHEYNEFQNIQRIGAGGFGNVYKANWKSSNTVVALKSFRNDCHIMKEIVNELQLLNAVHFHTNIIRSFGITKRKNNEDSDSMDYMLILEYADGGTLRDYLKENFNRLDSNMKLQFAIQIADAVSCLHQKNIIHRDLHSKNILIHQNIIKLADFGLSRRLAEVSNSVKDLFGILPYIDPQHYKGHYKSNMKSDVYSVGILLWEISSGRQPFESYDKIYQKTALLMEILKGKRETPVPDTPIDYINIYTKCWKDNPDDRPDIQQVFSELKQISLNINKMKILPISKNVDTIKNNNDNNSLSSSCNSMQINIENLKPTINLDDNEIETTKKGKKRQTNDDKSVERDSKNSRIKIINVENCNPSMVKDINCSFYDYNGIMSNTQYYPQEIPNNQYSTFNVPPAFTKYRDPTPFTLNIDNSFSESTPLPPLFEGNFQDFGTFAPIATSSEEQKPPLGYKNFLTCNRVWERIQQHPKFDDLEGDAIDQLCAKLPPLFEGNFQDFGTFAPIATSSEEQKPPLGSKNFLTCNRVWERIQQHPKFDDLESDAIDQLFAQLPPLLEGNFQDFGTFAPIATSSEEQKPPLGSKKFISCNEIRERIQQHPKFDDLEGDAIDQLCAKLKANAICSGNGPVIPEEELEVVLAKWEGR